MHVRVVHHDVGTAGSVVFRKHFLALLSLTLEKGKSPVPLLSNLTPLVPINHIWNYILL
jgi:hypothetical protein